MACGCKKVPQQQAGARAARPQRVARNAAPLAEGKVGYHPRRYYVMRVDESFDEDGNTQAEVLPTLAEAHKRLRDLGPGWKVEARRD
jgi:hypothetical protein